jgi:aminoglycoside/choline kinase family phosphotransferase
MAIDNRTTQLNKWAREQLVDMSIHVTGDNFLVSASDDASFRRYFRYEDTGSSYIFVDAPPEQEDSKPFVTVAGYLKAAGLNAPVVYQTDLGQGFMMLSDLGRRLYLSDFEDSLSEETLIDDRIDDALTAIRSMQSIHEPLPRYDESLLRTEMDLFPDWFLKQQLGLSLSEHESRMLEDVCRLLVENAQQQPQVFVHRDFHSRNLMVTDKQSPGILDFQDAVSGPITYDLVSLVRDCYFEFPEEKIAEYVERFREMLIENDEISDIDAKHFRRWFDLMGLQRHIKCAGIFSRLNIRDSKSGYLPDIPLVVRYMFEACAPYPELHEFRDWLAEVVEPRMKAAEFKQ